MTDLVDNDDDLLLIATDAACVASVGFVASVDFVARVGFVAPPVLSCGSRLVRLRLLAMALAGLDDFGRRGSLPAPFDITSTMACSCSDLCGCDVGCEVTRLRGNA